MLSIKPKPYILPTIILAQFACTSTWFAGNSIIESISSQIDLGVGIQSWVLSAVQLGFIIGTLVFALLMIADRFLPSKVFMVCAVLAALANLVMIIPDLNAVTLLLSRFGTGFLLAGIYPVGMKIAADYYDKGLGEALGFLVGALVLGSAFPYIVKGTDWGNHPHTVIQITSAITAIGGLLLYALVPNGPLRINNNQIQFGAGLHPFKNSSFRKAATGYFGHMWELYTFWSFTPLALAWYGKINSLEISISFWTGITIAMGGLSCAFGGILSKRIGSRKVALFSLIISGFFCLISPVLFQFSKPYFLMGWMLWGAAVTADSPQLSRLIANTAAPQLKGTALTFTTCIGFALTIVSIQLLTYLQYVIPGNLLFLPLMIGPAIGVWQLIGLKTD